MKKRLLILPALALTVLLCCAAVYAASDGRVAVTLSYLTGPFREQLVASLTEKLDQLNTVYQSAMEKLTARTGYDPSANWTATDTPRTLYPQSGETVTLSAGSGLFWYAGRGRAAGVLIDATMGEEVAEGVSLVPGHHYLTEQDVVITVSAPSHCGVEGRWFTNATGSAAPEPPEILSAGNDPADTGIAVSTTQTVLLDGVPREFQTYAILNEKGWQTNYIRLRDLAYYLRDTDVRFAADYVTSAGTVTVFMDKGEPYEVTGSELTTPFQGDREYTKASGTVVLNGTPVQLQAFLLTDDSGGGYTYYKLRDLGQALNFYMTLSAGVATLDTTRPYDYES